MYSLMNHDEYLSQISQTFTYDEASSRSSAQVHSLYVSLEATRCVNVN